MIYLHIEEPVAPDGAPLAFETALLERAAWQTIQDCDPLPEADATLVIASDARLQELNRTFLGIDAPTDVLSFTDGEVDPDTQRLHLGDVVISYPRALAQATAGGHPVEAELQLLVVHGALHLLGFDHTEEQDKIRMWARQAEILTRLGCPITSPVEPT